MREVVTCLLVAASLAAFARSTLPALPPNGGNLNYTADADAGSVLLLNSGMLSQPVARWQVSDYVIFKVAYSPTWRLTMVATPFAGGHWDRLASATVEDPS